MIQLYDVKSHALLAPAPDPSPVESVTPSIPPTSPVPAGTPTVRPTLEGASEAMNMDVVIGLLSLLVAVIGVGLALYAIWNGNRQGRQAEVNVFEHTVLLELARLTDDGIPRMEHVTTRLALLPATDVPFWRRWVEVRFESDSRKQLDEALDAIGAPADLAGNERTLWALREDIRRSAEQRGHRTSSLPTLRRPRGVGLRVLSAPPPPIRSPFGGGPNDRLRL